MRAGILSIAVVALGGCSLLLGTDDLAGDGASTNVDGGGSSGGNGDGATTPGTTPGSDGGGGDASGPSSKRTPGPLVYVQQDGVWRTRVDGFFELTFKNAMHWHPTDWVDLGMPGATNLAGAPAFYQAPRALVNGTWCEDTAMSATSDGQVDLFDDTPVVLSFNSFVHHSAGTGVDVDVKRWARFHVHATGRIVVEPRLTNGASTTFTADPWTYHDLRLTQQVGWERVELPNKSAVAFFSKTGTSSIVLINQAGETTLGGDDHQASWSMGAATLAAGDEITKLGEIQLGVTKDDLVARVDDVRNPALEVLSGGNGAASTYILASGIYSVQATSGTLQFALGPTRARYYPTFDIRAFSSPTWKLSLDGVVIASAQTPSTQYAVAKYDPVNTRLLVAYFGVIPANAPTAKRTFVLER